MVERESVARAKSRVVEGTCATVMAIFSQLGMARGMVADDETISINSDYRARMEVQDPCGVLPVMKLTRKVIREK